MSDEWYEENGRLYHNWQRGLYMYPHDEMEKERLDVLHNLFYEHARIALHSSRLTLTPGRPPRMLDVGCGTGFWAIEMADKYRDAEVIGIDLANIQPRHIPPNVTFQIPSNFDSLWNYGQDSFDIIHLQLLSGSVSSWPHLYRKVFSHLRPGYGFIEQLEIDLEPRCDDGTLEPNSPLVNWYRYLIDATSRTSKPLAYQHNTRQLLEQAGFIDISETIIKVPYHHWPRDPQQAHMGDYYQLTMNQIMGLEALCMAPFSRVFEWTQAQIETFTGQVRHEIQSTRIHAYNNM